MKNIFVLFLLIIPFTFSQNKYLIYFKDKGINPTNVLDKNSAAYIEAVNHLMAHSITRREKVMGKDNIITFEDFSLNKDYINNLQAMGIKIENQLRWFNAVSAYLTSEQISQVTSSPFVKSVEPVRIIKFTKEKTFSKTGIEKTSGVPTQIDYGGAYGQLNLSDIPIVHSKGINGAGVIVGILDDGFIWKEHESLVNAKVLAEYNFVFHDSSTAPQPSQNTVYGYHGTMVFSIIGGYKDSSIIGSAYGASFILAKTEDDRSESHIEEDNYAAALEWMESLGVDLTTSSLGYNIFDDTTYSYTPADMNGITTICAKAANLAFQRGVLTFTAAGNEGGDSWNIIDTPADALDILAAGAVDSENNLADFSSRGPTADGRIKPDVVAQGVEAFGADVSSGFSSYEVGDGTSFSTPISSGIGALLLSAYPYLTNVQVRNIILETSANANTPNNNIGYGLISAKRAISYPNLSDTSGNYRINKIFFSTNAITNAYIYYSLNSSLFSTQSLSYDGKLKYSFAVPQLTEEQVLSFYFTYLDNTGKSYREPSSGFYNFKYGQTNIVNSIISNVNTATEKLSNNYPNPFYSNSQYTYIDFYANSSENAKIIIFNTLGQRIKILFNGVATAGKNTVAWDGKNDRGAKCASGVYYYILNIEGKKYGNKMMIIK
ncbi:MAG: S8 family serine peptidase [Ignavibacteriaceae bacterium]|jgi:hypothetical protein